MNLNIANKKAIAASKGLGRACAVSLAHEGAHVTIIARRPDPLEHTAMDIRNLSNIQVTTVAADITTSESCTQDLAVAAKVSITFKLATDRRLVNPQHFRNPGLLISCF